MHSMSRRPKSRSSLAACISSSGAGSRDENRCSPERSHDDEPAAPHPGEHCTDATTARKSEMAGFVARLDEINALADRSPGFVWRLQTGEGNATYLRPSDEDRVLFNLSVWESERRRTSECSGRPCERIRSSTDGHAS